MKDWKIEYSVYDVKGNIIKNETTKVQNQPNAFFAKTYLAESLKSKYGICDNQIVMHSCEQHSVFSDILNSL